MLKKDLRCLSLVLKKEKMSIVLGLTCGVLICYPHFMNSSKDNVIAEEKKIFNLSSPRNTEIKSASVCRVPSSLVTSMYSTISDIAIVDDELEDSTEEISSIQEVTTEKQASQESIEQQSWDNEVSYCMNAEPNVPNYNSHCVSNFKSYMDYRKVSDSTSAQYSFLRSADCYTDEITGIRKVGDRYCVAVGSAYCTEIGTKFNLVLENGNIIKCILGDTKAIKDTDEYGMYCTGDGSVVEFIVDNSTFNYKKDSSGTVNFVDGFDGAITKVVVID